MIGKYGDYVCFDCGVPYLTDEQKEKPMTSTWHNGVCCVCNEEKSVTNKRAYNYLRK